MWYYFYDCQWLFFRQIQWQTFTCHFSNTFFYVFLYLYMIKSNIYFTPNLLYNNNYLKLRGTLDFEIMQLMLCPLVLITVFILVVLYHYYLNIIQIVFK